MPEGRQKPPALHISQFEPAKHDRRAFTCGFAPIDIFLKMALTDHIKAGYLTAYMATQEGQKDVIGFYTLNAFAVGMDHMETPKRPHPPPTLPAIYIKALGVRTDFQGQGLGTALMVHAMRTAMAVSRQVGSVAIVLDVLRDNHFDRRLEFYQNLGFQLMNDPEHDTRVYVSMKDVIETFGP